MRRQRDGPRELELGGTRRRLQRPGRVWAVTRQPDGGTEAGQGAVDSPRALFEQSDAVSLHVAGAAPIVDYDLLCAMRPPASLINPSRGNLVVDGALTRRVQY